jgi:small conductance mechanosensitive channel
MPIVLKILLIVFIIAGGRWLLHLASRLAVAGISIAGASDKVKENVHRWIRGIIEVIGDAIIFGIVLLLLLDIVGIDVRPFLVGAGVVGIAAGILLNTVLGMIVKEFSPRIFFLFEDQYQVGDYVKINVFHEGTVETIGKRVTKLRGNGGEEIIIANTAIANGTVINFSRGYHGDPNKKA